MAATLPTTSSSYLYSTTSLPKTSLSCANKVYVGLRAQSPNSFGVATSSVNFEFFNRVYKNVAFRSRDFKATRAQVSMMPIGTPQVPYRNPVEGTLQWVDLWNALYRERVMFIGEDITEEFSNQLLATMLYLDSVDDTKRLWLYISGPGGDITPAMGIYDTMQSLRSPVGTHCVGYVFNLAAYILAAGEKGYRSAMPLSRIALQSPGGAARGQADDMRNETDELIRLRDYLYRELSEKTGQPVEKIHKDLDRTKRLTAQEALEYGLIDRVTRSSRIKADAPLREATAGLG